MDPDRITFHQQAYTYVKSQILHLKLKPGQYITDSEIAAQLSISRTPVREAFHRLEQEGLLVYEARRGWRVYVLTLEDIHEIFDLKELVEGMLVHKAAESAQRASYRKALEQALQAMRQAVAAEDAEAWLTADAQLHETLFQMASNERAAGLIRGLNEQWHRLRIGFTVRQERMKRSVREHEQIIQLVLMGDGPQAEAQMRQHLHNVRTELVELLVNMVLPFASNGV